MSAPSPLPSSLVAALRAMLQAVVGHVINRTRFVPLNREGVLIPLALGNLISAWINQRRERILALLARIAAGTQRAPRDYEPRATRAEDAPERGAPARRMPNRFAWLCALAQEVRVEGSCLGRLINEAEMKAAILAHPQMGRLLRPLLRMLGERPPIWMPPPPKRPRRSYRRQPCGPATARDGAPAPDPCIALDRLVAETMERHRQRQRAARPMHGPPIPGPQAQAQASHAALSGRTGLTW